MKPDFDASREKLAKLSEGEGSMTKEEFTRMKAELEALVSERIYVEYKKKCSYSTTDYHFKGYLEKYDLKFNLVLNFIHFLLD